MDQPPTPAPTPTRKRIRLAPALRKQLILDAALGEFSVHGFGATTTEAIAARAGLSQAGLYTHFKSKDAILETLFSEVLTPQWSQWMGENEPFTEGRIDSLIDHWYARVADPRFLAVFRLLVAESSRLSDTARRWREATVVPYLAEQQRIVDCLVRHGHMQKNPLSDMFQLASSPLIYVMLMHLFSTGADDSVRLYIERMREAHRALFKQFLAVPPDQRRTH